MRAVLYLRQSLAADELAVDRQRTACQRVCATRGWEIAGEYMDNDVSASQPRRATSAYARLVADARAGKVTAVVVSDLDRLTRRPREIEDWIDLAVDRGVRLVTADGEVDAATENGRMYLRIKAAVSRHEIERKGARQREAAAQAAADGRRIGGRRPFGYEPDGLTLLPREAAAIRRAYTDVLDGVPVGRIAREWTAAGLHTPQGTRDGRPRPWDSQSVRVVLLNPRYAGLRAHVTGAAAKLNPVKARLASIVGPARWPAVVDEEVWRAVVAVLTDPGRVSPGRTARRLLSGLAHCGVCDDGVPLADLQGGCRCRRIHAGGTTSGLPAYRCRAAFGHVGRRADPVEMYVGERVIERVSRPDARQLLLPVAAVPDVPGLRTELAALRQRRRSLARLVVDGTLTEAEVRADASRLAERIAEVEAGLADAGRVSVLGPLVGAPDPSAAWDALDTDRRRQVVAELMEVLVLPAGRGSRRFRPETVLVVPSR